ncbi:hypothetical protein L1987_60667 [Smallanthus sonchifolius]|uniref:Uncharacterized protein n=1 Tax=Smallanthus sonchifolius TaxID=185202 RepID=A0ACB9D9B5_9ASTR|nr:hypothetical protein L1987_60667 [Smallanthus sonchifolius]
MLNGSSKNFKEVKRLGSRLSTGFVSSKIQTPSNEQDGSPFISCLECGAQPRVKTKLYPDQLLLRTYCMGYWHGPVLSGARPRVTPDRETNILSVLFPAEHGGVPSETRPVFGSRPLSFFCCNGARGRA